ncbi:hypothetical protein DV872_14770 [Oceanispirochaeta sp. M1]|nr:hypothetical protein DV872_14770 [Oceanispirochaeta sp. M1]
MLTPIMGINGDLILPSFDHGKLILCIQVFIQFILFIRAKDCPDSYNIQVGANYRRSHFKGSNLPIENPKLLKEYSEKGGIENSQFLEFI